ncbi:hypothetical protein WP1_194 [Pseudomonas phage WP1]
MAGKKTETSEATEETRAVADGQRRRRSDY